MTTTATLTGGILTITDSDNGADNLEISFAGGAYTITDIDGNLINTSIAGATGDGTDTVTIPDTGVTGINFDLLDGEDTVTVLSLPATGLTDGVTITGGAGEDVAIIDAATNTGAGDIDINADFIFLDPNADLDTTTGEINLDADERILLDIGSSLGTVDGDITLSANLDLTPQSPFPFGNLQGILLGNATIETTGSGNISLSGVGGDFLFGEGGVTLFESTIRSTGTSAGSGTITIDGNGTFSDNFGVLIAVDSEITSADGAILLTGNASFDDAIRIDTGSVISSTGEATITLNGTNNDSSGDGGNVGDGVQIEGSQTEVTSVSGDIQITGNATNSDGVQVAEGASVSSTGTGATAANITITGTTVGEQELDDGVIIDDSNTSISSVDGDIQITGEVTGATGSGDGVEIDSNTSVVSTGSGNINITGTTANSNQNGIELNGILGAATGTGSTSLNTDVLNLEDSTAPGVDLIEVNSPAGGTDIDVVNTFFNNVEVNGATIPGTDYDQLKVNSPGSDIDLTNSDLGITADPSYTPATNDEITLINNVDPTSTVTGTFNGLPEGATVNINGTDFAISYQGGDGNDVVLTECFLTGTLILIESGYRAVEELNIGDKVKTADGKLEPIKWVGRQTVDAHRVRNPLRGYPVLIKAGALGNNTPIRDLYISPDHALLVDGLLINAGALVNDISILKTEPTETFVYHHIELENHSLLIAEGTYAESYLPQHEDRLIYDNGAEYDRLYPNSTSKLMLYPMDYPRVSSRSKVPRFVSKKLIEISESFSVVSSST
ncbi:MAG: Hint domain-containing protein [Cyanobacteria bacterium P01_C01_bin.72]